jgi:hypothetical protein
MIRMRGDHRARTPSCFAVADRLETEETTQRHQQPSRCERCAGLREPSCRAHIPMRDVARDHDHDGRGAHLGHTRPQRRALAAVRVHRTCGQKTTAARLYEDDRSPKVVIDQDLERRDTGLFLVSSHHGFARQLAQHGWLRLSPLTLAVTPSISREKLRTVRITR